MKKVKKSGGGVHLCRNILYWAKKKYFKKNKRNCEGSNYVGIYNYLAKSKNTFFKKVKKWGRGPIMSECTLLG